MLCVTFQKYFLLTSTVERNAVVDHDLVRQWVDLFEGVGRPLDVDDFIERAIVLTLPTLVNITFLRDQISIL